MLASMLGDLGDLEQMANNAAANPQAHEPYYI